MAATPPAAPGANEPARARRWRAAAGCGVLVAVIGWLALLLPAVAELEQDFGLRALFALRGPVPAPADVVVVALDETAEPDPQRPHSWSRRDQAAVVRYLAGHGARLICFDLTFSNPAADPAVDAEFEQALREAGNVLLTESVHDIGDGAVVETLPLPAFDDAALGHAPFVLPKEARVNRYWRHFSRPTGGTPALPLLAHRAHAAEAGDGAERRARVRRWMAEPTEGELAYLNFYGPPRSIPTMAHATVLAHARAEAAGRGTAGLAALPPVAGKTVFIGFSALTARAQDQLRDSYATVFTRPDGLDLGGVEIAATAFANLQQGRVLQPASPVGGTLFIAVWGLLAGALGRSLRPARALAALAAGAGVCVAFALQQFNDASRWWPVVVPLLLQAPLALLAGVWLQQREAAAERAQIRRALGFYLPPAAVEQLSRQVGPFTSGNRVVFGACLSTDLENYTTLAEQMPPAALGELMNRYYAELFVPVERSHGAVVDIVGDAMVAVWAQAGTPQVPAAHACGAALDIRAALARFDAGPGHPPMATRLGLHTGDMLIGAIGASGHYEYRAVGDVINTASRIQALNKVLGTRLLASAETVAGLDGFVTRPLGSFLLAGKANPVAIVEVLGREADAALHRPLVDRFAAATALVQERRWPAARAAFEAIAAAVPGDGPSRFYAAQCTRWVADPPPADTPLVIRIDTK